MLPHTGIRALAHPGLGEIPPVADFTNLSGLGASGVVDGQEVLVAASRLLAQHDISVAAALDEQRTRWEGEGCTTVAAADGVVEGVFALADTVKPTAAAAITGLLRLGLGTALLTDDNAATT